MRKWPAKLSWAQAAALLAAEALVLIALGLWVGYRFFWKHYPAPTRKQVQLEQAQAAVQAAPEDWRAWVNLGYAQYEAGYHEEAEKSYLRARRLNPEAAWIDYFLGLVYYQQGRWPQAAQAFSKVIKAYPQSLLPRYQLALVRHREGKNEQALRELDEVRRLDPYLADTYTLTGKVYEALGERELARQNLLRALELNPLDEEARSSLQRLER